MEPNVVCNLVKKIESKVGVIVMEDNAKIRSAVTHPVKRRSDLNHTKIPRKQPV